MIVIAYSLQQWLKKFQDGLKERQQKLLIKTTATGFVLVLILKTGKVLTNMDPINFITQQKSYFNLCLLKKTFSTIVKNRYEEINRLRNGDITQHLTSVDIEEIVRSGGYFLDIIERYICDNLEYNPSFIIDMTEKNQKKIQEAKKPCYKH